MLQGISLLALSFFPGSDLASLIPFASPSRELCLSSRWNYHLFSEASGKLQRSSDPAAVTASSLPHLLVTSNRLVTEVITSCSALWSSS